MMNPVIEVINEEGQEMAMSQLAKEFVSYFNCDCTVFTPRRDQAVIEKAYFQALEEGRGKFTPVLVVVSENLFQMIQINVTDNNSLSFSQETAQGYRQKLVGEADAQRGRAFLKARAEESLEQFKEAGVDGAASTEEAEKIDSFTAIREFRGGTKEVILAKLPTAVPWEAGAYVPMGGWNECPMDKDMISVLKYWYDKHGAQAAVIDGDIMEFVVPRPVEDEKAARELACEQYGFCCDRIEQCRLGYTLGDLAGSLMHSKIWFFWWD